MAEVKTAEHTGLSETFVRSFAERYHGAWNHHHVDAIIALVTGDIVFEDPFIYPDGVARGREELRAAAYRWWRAIPDLRFTTQDLFLSLDGRSAAHAWTGTGTLRGRLDPPGFAPTDQGIHMYGVSTWEFRGELLAHLREHSDTYAVARQVGAVPQPRTNMERAGVLLQRLEARRLRRRMR